MDEPKPRAPFIEPQVSEPKSLIGTSSSLILQAASGGTLDGGPGPSDGGVD